MQKMITTTMNFEGYKITEYYGIVSKNVKVDNKLSKDLSAGWEESLQKACDEIIECLPEGANAIIGLRPEYRSSGVSICTIFGTAVHVEPV